MDFLNTDGSALDRLRRKIEPDPAQPRYLHTERSVGYWLDKGRIYLLRTYACHSERSEAE
ncbi:MAG: winged helix-turn-helix domain-containing protein [Anaerolineae bacterium]|nr:winged helix-turn-helix domain-containing protein [Anaerolineae bacterium]